MTLRVSAYVMVAIALSLWVGAAEVTIGYLQLQQAISACESAGCPINLIDSAKATGFQAIWTIIGALAGGASGLYVAWMIPESTRPGRLGLKGWKTREAAIRDEWDPLKIDTSLSLLQEAARLQQSSAQAVSTRGGTLLGISTAYIGGVITALALRTVAIDDFWAIQALVFLVIAEAAFFYVLVGAQGSSQVGAVEVLTDLDYEGSDQTRNHLIRLSRWFEENEDGLFSKQTAMVSGAVLIVMASLVLVLAVALG